ncbi:MFS general substrate transporter [Mycena kentingensis (nom. inval.)]|nr:MFS general substrate transporter [Mycena kentingensis (nom. inval.)]
MNAEEKRVDVNALALDDLEKATIGQVEKMKVLPLPDAAEFPEGGTRAWLTVLGAFCINFCGFGYATAFGVYQDYYVREYLSESSPSAISWIGSLNALLGVSMSLVSGPLYDRGNILSVIYTGCFFQAFSLFILSFCRPQQLYQILLVQGIGFGAGLGLTYVPAVAIVSHYFHRRRSLVMALAQSGVPLGALIHPILLNNLLPYSGPAESEAGARGRMSFANATRVSAGLVTAILVLGCVMVKPRPGFVVKSPREECEAQARPSRKGLIVGFWISLKRVWKDRPYVFATVGMVTYVIAFWYPVFFLQLAATTHGMSDKFAFYVLVIMNGAGLVGRVSSGFIAEIVGVAPAVTASTAAGTAFVFCFLALKDVGSTVVLAVLGGYFFGFYAALLPSLLASLTDDCSELGMRMGLSFTIEGIGGLIGPPICGALLTSRFIWWRPTLFSGIMGLVGFSLFAAASMSERRKIAMKKLAAVGCE